MPGMAAGQENSGTEDGRIGGQQPSDQNRTGKRQYPGQIAEIMHRQGYPVQAGRVSRQRYQKPGAQSLWKAFGTNSGQQERRWQQKNGRGKMKKRVGKAEPGTQKGQNRKLSEAFQEISPPGRKRQPTESVWHRLP